VDEAGNLAEALENTSADPVVFTFSDVAERSFVLQDKTKLTGAQIAESIRLVIDTIDQEQREAAANRQAKAERLMAEHAAQAAERADAGK
jgi:hypothetical protein